MPYTPDKQRIVDYVERRLSHHRNELKLWHSGSKDHDVPGEISKAACIGWTMGAENELQRMKEILEDIKATRDKEYPCDQKGE